MECKLYKSLSELPSYYQELFESTFDSNYYSSADWFDTLFKTTKKPNEELLIFGVEEGENALGLLFMVQSKESYGPFSIKKISSLTNNYSVTFSPVINGAINSESEIIDLLFRTLLSSQQKWDIVEFKNMEQESPSFENFQQHLTASKYIIQDYFCHKNWYENTKNEDFDTYLVKRKSKIKSNHRRRLKKIENELGKPEFRLYSGPSDLDKAIQEFNKIYALSWKGVEQHPIFIEEIIRSAAAKNILRLGVYSAGGKTLAVKLTFATKTIGHMYKTAYDPEYKKYGAGTAINMFMIEHLLNVDKVEHLDFGIGNEPYKSDLMESSRERWGITAYNSKSIFGLLIGQYYTTGHLIKTSLTNFLKPFRKKKPEKQTVKKLSATESNNKQTSFDLKHHLTCYDSITKLPETVKASMSQLDKTSFFKGGSWFELLEKHALPEKSTIKIYVLQDASNKSPLLVYPLLVNRQKTPFGIKTTLSDFSTLYGIEFSPIFLKKNLSENDLLICFFAKLKNDLKWDILNIGLLYDRQEKPDTPFQKHLSACKANFSLVDKYYHSMNWTVHIKNHDFLTYFSERPKKLQNTIRRKKNKLQKSASSEIVIYDDMTNIEKAIEDYMEIYQLSWKTAENSPDFIQNFIRKTAQLNILRLGILYIDGKPASFVKMILCGNKAVIYKLAYSPDYRNYSPGSILLYEMIKHVVKSDNVEYIDFGIGDDSFKKDWMHIKSQVFGIIVFNKKSMIGLFNASKHYFGKLLKNS